MVDELRLCAMRLQRGDRVIVAGRWREIRDARTDRYATGGLAMVLIFETGPPLRLPAASELTVVPANTIRATDQGSVVRVAGWSLNENTAGGSAHT
ncbi:hypothetical protein ACFVWZ_32220 [Streptomyces sp. NPDC058200]|uniref:hypothetical protein n=1 Tax=Streptomyces sp. NPDC058200 TaxID=3346378 RepID=UPI0036F183A5